MSVSPRLKKSDANVLSARKSKDTPSGMIKTNASVVSGRKSAISGMNKSTASVLSPRKSKETPSAVILAEEPVDSRFPQITCMEDVITNFFNQIVQYVIDDMVVVEPKEEEGAKEETTSDVVKDYKDLEPEDLVNAEVKTVSGSKVTLSKRPSSQTGMKKKSSLLPTLQVIKEDESQRNSSLQDIEMDEERQVKIYFVNGNVYEGRIYKRIMNGKGRYMWSDGTVYEGEFKDGFPTGVGRMTLPDLSHYEGEFFHGVFNGKGFLNIVSTPSFYSGEWKDGKKHGNGWLLYEPGDWYEGGWANDLRNGFGLRCYKNGSKYLGQWHKGHYDGEGTMIWDTNDYYKGEWKKGAMHGYGEYIWRAFYNNTFTFPIQNIYRGSWENGKRSGTGTMLFGDDTGIKLTGEWDQDFKHGAGHIICGNGRVLHHPMLFQYDKPLRLGIEPSTWSMKTGSRIFKNFEIPIFTAPEYVDVGFYVDRVLEQLKDVLPEKMRALRAYEEKCIQNTIIRNLLELKELYQEYSSLAAKAQLTFEPVLIRLFLWQFYKDKHIWKCGISLGETDQILADNPSSCVESLHDPFEPIYFWQFLMSLIGVALITYSLEEIDETPHQGVSASVIKKFFDEIIFAKANVSHENCLLLNYLDMAPIKAVYALYQKVGEPHSARTFLRSTCTRKGETPLLCSLDLYEQKAEPQFGTNLVPFDQYILFESRDGQLGDEFRHKWSSLFNFRHLGPRNVVRCLAQACPLIKEGGLVVNIDYPLTFLEFYETLLNCIFMVLELEMRKEQRILMEQLPHVDEPSVASSKTRSIKKERKREEKNGKSEKNDKVEKNDKDQKKNKDEKKDKKYKKKKKKT